MSKADGQSRHSGKEKSAIDAHWFDERQLLDLENDDVGEEEDAEDVELHGIDVPTWEKKNQVQAVSYEHRLEVLHQHHDSQVVGHLGKQRTEELVSQNFIWD